MGEKKEKKKGVKGHLQMSSCSFVVTREETHVLLSPCRRNELDYINASCVVAEESSNVSV